MFLERIGCFSIENEQINSLEHQDSPLEIVKACGSVAWSRGLKVFAVHNGNECLGDKHLPSILPRLHASNGCLGGTGGQNLSDVYRLQSKKAFPYCIAEKFHPSIFTRSFIYSFFQLVFHLFHYVYLFTNLFSLSNFLVCLFVCFSICLFAVCTGDFCGSNSMQLNAILSRGSCNQLRFHCDFSAIDLFSLYVLLPHFRPRDGTLENHCFQILKY